MESTGEGLNTSQIQSLKDAIDSGNTAGARDLFTQISTGPKTDSFDAMGPVVEGTGTAGLVEKQVGDEVHMVRLDGKEGPPSLAAQEGAAEEARLGVTRENVAEIQQQAQQAAKEEQNALVEQAVAEAETTEQKKPFTWKDIGVALFQLLTLGLIGKLFKVPFRKIVRATQGQYASQDDIRHDQYEELRDLIEKEKQERHRTPNPPTALPQAA